LARIVRAASTDPRAADQSADRILQARPLVFVDDVADLGLDLAFLDLVIAGHQLLKMVAQLFG
jgi:hypothetical protein